MPDQYQGNGNGGVEPDLREREVVVANNRNMRGNEVVLRLVVLVFTLTAAVVLGVNKESKTVGVTLVAMQPPVYVHITTKSHYVASFVFFVVANAIECFYVAVSLLLILTNRKGKRGITMMITLIDIAMLALVFAGVGAAGTIGLLGYKGNKHVGWNKVCYVFQKFCGQAIAAVIISAIGGTIHILLVVLSIFNLYNKH